MLDNIHAHWKRRRVCKIKCKGVCTVDMDNVHQQLEERTGGKIIYRKGGVIYLFRGRNYNYRTRPRFPLMLWKPIPPVYPRLIKQVPEGLTLEEVTEMRKKGLKLIPICKLGKNGVYCDLVKNVREAFEECELVRINCQGINGSDYRRIGAKLKDLVPCVLISFAYEHILVWRGQKWKSSLPKLDNGYKEAKTSNIDDAISIAAPLEDQEVSANTSKISANDASLETLGSSMSSIHSVDVDVGCEDLSSRETVYQSVGTEVDSNVGKTNRIETIGELTGCSDDEPEPGNALMTVGIDDKLETMSSKCGSDVMLDDKGYTHEGLQTNVGSDINAGTVGNTASRVEAHRVENSTQDKLLDVSEVVQDLNEPARSSAPWTEGVLLLRKQAIDNGSAVILDDSSLDDDIIYQRAVAMARSAPPGPVFRHQFRKTAVQKLEEQESGDIKKVEEQETGDLEVMGNTLVSSERREKKSRNIKRPKDFDKLYQDVVPQGSLRVDELAKLLA